LIHGLKRTADRPNTIVANGNTEYRLRRSAFERYTWQYPGSTLMESSCGSTTFGKLSQFFADRDGGINSFKFQDPYYPNFVNAKLSNAGGSNWYLRIPVDTNTPGLHRVFNLSLGSTTATKNGVNTTITSASITTAGEPIITINGSTSGDTIRISGPCYLTARFEGPLNYTIAGLKSDNSVLAVEYDTITLKEVFETTL
jgi:hypothetical protein